MTFLNEHGTKIYGALTSLFGTLGSLVASGAFDKLLSEVGRGWVGITCALATAVLGGMLTARGFNNSTAEKVAGAMQDAINATPPKQGGFARIGMLLAVAVAAIVLITGCGTNPATGERHLTATEKVAMQELATIALRRSIGDSPRAQEKVANIRHVATRLQAATAVTSIGELRLVVDAELDRLKLTAIDRADANSLLNIFQALLIERIGKDEIDAQALVTVNEFVSMIVQALPPS